MPSFRKAKASPNILNAHIALFFAFFLTGILLANFRFSDETFWMGYQLENACRILKSADRSWENLIPWALKNRLLLWTALCVLSRIRHGNLALFAFTGWFALSLGFIFSSLTEQFSFAGIALCTAVLFPQIFLYLPAGILLIKSEANRKPAAGIRFLLITGIFLAGIMSEYFLNPRILEKIYGLISLLF